jgi:hypothetical protein
VKLKSLAVAAVVSFLSACGGGEPSADQPLTSATPSRLQAAAPLRAAHATFTVARFVAWAESTYPQFFNGSVVTGTEGIFQYRYYPATRNYLALGGTDGLYAMGPVTGGQIMSVGTLDTLSCSVYPANCEPGSDIAGSASTTAVLNLFAGAASAIDAEDDTDWFAVDLTAGVTYTFDLEGASTGKGTLKDPYLALYSAAGSWLEDNDDVAYPSNTNARFTYKPAASGRYYLEASAYRGTGTYQLTATMSGGAADGAPISGATDPTALLQAMGTAVYRTTFDNYIYYVQLDSTGANLTSYVCNAGTTPTCGSRTTSTTSGSTFGNFMFDTRTLSLSMVESNVILQPTTDTPANFGRAELDPCSVHPPGNWDGICLAPITLTGGWAGTWSWTGVNRTCTFNNGGGFTMSVTQSSSGSGSISGSGSAGGVQTRDSADCSLAETGAKDVSVSGTATSGTRLALGTAQLRLTVGSVLYLASGQFDGQQFTGTVTRDVIGGSGTISLLRQ